MTKRTIYISFDGKEFATEKECVKYETFNKLKDIIPTLKTIQEICNKYSHCHECVFCNEGSDNCMFRKDTPEWWDLSEIKKRIGD